MAPSRMETRAQLEHWVRWLDHLGVQHSVVVFRDPDNIRLELIAREVRS